MEWVDRTLLFARTKRRVEFVSAFVITRWYDNRVIVLVEHIYLDGPRPHWESSGR